MLKYLAQVILISFKKLSIPEQLEYLFWVVLKSSPAVYLLNWAGAWFVDNQQFATFLCVALIANMTVGGFAHARTNTFNWLEFFKGNAMMVFVVSVTYLMLEMLRYTAGDNLAGEVFRITIQLTTLLYPTSKVLKNIFIMTSGKYPPEFIMNRLYNFEKNGDLSDFFKNQKNNENETDN